MPTLDQLAVGAGGRIETIVGDDTLSQRLMDMGLTEGEEVQLVAVAPLGDPLEIRVRGYQLSLRRAEACRIILSAAP